MGVAHDVEPLVRRCLVVTVQNLTNAIDEDFRAATRDAVQAGRDQPLDDGGHRQPRQPRNVNHLGRRQRVQLEVGKP